MPKKRTTRIYWRGGGVSGREPTGRAGRPAEDPYRLRAERRPSRGPRSYSPTQVLPLPLHVDGSGSLGEGRQRAA